MPLLVPRVQQQPPAAPPPVEEPRPAGSQVVWYSPCGTEISLSDTIAPGAFLTNEGVAGLGAAPREVVRQELAAGGSFARWGQVTERIITLPVFIYADTREEFLAWRREFTRHFTDTVPPASVPKPGRLRVLRSDGSWREIRAIYLDGLTWEDESSQGSTYDIAVIQLVAPDPYWYGEITPVLEFQAAPARNYLSPYETVSPDRSLGQQVVEIAGDNPVLPVWEFVGPATSVQVEIVGGPKLLYGNISAGETVTIDTSSYTVVNQLGQNRIGRIDWSVSELFQIPNGTVTLNLTLNGGVAGQSAIRLSYRARWETA